MKKKISFNPFLSTVYHELRHDYKAAVDIELYKEAFILARVLTYFDTVIEENKYTLNKGDMYK